MADWLTVGDKRVLLVNERRDLCRFGYCDHCCVQSECLDQYLVAHDCALNDTCSITGFYATAEKLAELAASKLVGDE